MNSDSIRLAWAGAAIGLLVLSAVVFAGARPPARREDGGTGPALAERMPGPTDFEGEAVAALAETEAAEPVTVVLRAEDPVPGERLFLCDAGGCPLEEIEPGVGGETVLGPLTPACYGIWRGGTEIASFRLLRGAALDRTSGRLWTDGTVLYLERFETGTVRLRLILGQPGYESFQLCDRDGRRRSGDLYVPDSALPDQGRGYVRLLEFRGLAPGLYTLVRAGEALLQLTVRSGETAEAALRIEEGELRIEQGDVRIEN